jgi:hypothetical protein
MARPMPREAPVTSAHLACVLNVAHCRLPTAAFASARLAGSNTVAAIASRVDALDHAGQHLARPAFDDVGQPARTNRLHHLDPAHRAEGLADRAHRGWRRFVFGLHVDVVDDGHRGREIAHAASLSLSRSAAGFIRLEWNGADTGSGSARLAPAAFRLRRPFRRRLGAGDHRLLRDR